MQPSSAPASGATTSSKEAPTLPPDYALVPFIYPDDTTAYLAMLEEVFRTDPNQVYISSSIKNPATQPLRKHMRLARFKNSFEGLDSDSGNESKDMEELHMKLIYKPTGAIVGACSWELPATTTTNITASSSAPPPRKTPYPLLPPNTTLPPEDAALSTLGPTMESALEAMTSRIPLLSDASTRSKQWWYLSILGVAPSHQGKRLGEAMVHWGLQRALADKDARPEAGIRGCWVKSSEAGARTYRNAGFEGVAGVRVVFGDGEGGFGVRFRDIHVDVDGGRDGDDDDGEKEWGQDFVVLVRQF